MSCSKVQEDEQSVNADETKVDCRLVKNPLHKSSKVSFFSVVHCHMYKRWNEWVPEANLQCSSVACVEIDLTISLQKESYRLIRTRPWRLKTVASFIFDPLHAKAPTSKSVAWETSRGFRDGINDFLVKWRAAEIPYWWRISTQIPVGSASDWLRRNEILFSQ